MSLTDLALSDDESERQQARDVAKGKVLHAALLVAALPHNAAPPQAHDDATAEYYDDQLAEAVLEYAEVLRLVLHDDH